MTVVIAAGFARFLVGVTGMVVSSPSLLPLRMSPIASSCPRVGMRGGLLVQRVVVVAPTSVSLVSSEDSYFSAKSNDAPCHSQLRSYRRAS